MKSVRSSLAFLFLSLLSSMACAADKADQPVEQVGSGVVIGFFVFCVVGIAAWIFYTSRASKREREKKE